MVEEGRRGPANASCLARRHALFRATRFVFLARVPAAGHAPRERRAQLLQAQGRTGRSPQPSRHAATSDRREGSFESRRRMRPTWRLPGLWQTESPTLQGWAAISGEGEPRGKDEVREHGRASPSLSSSDVLPLHIRPSPAVLAESLRVMMVRRTPLLHLARCRQPWASRRRSSCGRQSRSGWSDRLVRLNELCFGQDVRLSPLLGYMCRRQGVVEATRRPLTGRMT